MSAPQELSSQLTISSGATTSLDIETLLNLYRPYLLKIANDTVSIRIQSKLAPSDLVQETFLRAAQTYDRFRGVSEQELKAWLTKILKRVTIDGCRAFRSQKREATRELLDTEGSDRQGALGLPGKERSPSSLMSANEDRQRIGEALGFLSDDHRRVVEMFFFDGLEFHEISEQLGRSSDAVRKLWGRAIQKLSVILNFHE